VCDPAITTVGPGVTPADKAMIKGGVNLLNSSKLSLFQADVLGHLKGIQMYGQSGRSGMSLRTGVFRVNVNEFRGQSLAWTATQIAHDAYHQYRYDYGFYKGTGLLEERLALLFQMGVGANIGLEPHYLDYLYKYFNAPKAINDRISQPVCK
jgi:hypothetical protein